MKRTLPALVFALFAVIPLAAPAAEPAPSGEVAAIEKTIHASIGWALTKDKDLGQRVLSHGPDLFIFHPDSKTTVVGWESMEKLWAIWMDPRFKATHYEIKELRVNLSHSGDVSWFSAILDDCGEWDGKPSCWRDTRWTGVLEKRGGEWVIVQMHFSFAKDRRPAEEAKTDARQG